MNILIVYPHGNALNNRGGAETRIWNIVSSLLNLNYNVSILHSNSSKGFEDKKLKDKVHIFYYQKITFYHINDRYLSDFNLFFIIKLLQIIRKQKIDIIQLEFPWGFLIAKLLAKKKIILIYDSHGIEREYINIVMKHPKFPKILKPLAKFYIKFYEKLVCKLAHIIINVSEVDRNFYIKNYDIHQNKTILIQIPSALENLNVLDRESLKNKSRERLNLSLDKTIIIFHGSLPHIPNHEAFNIIINNISQKINDPNILFVLAGYKLKKFKKNNIISLGFVENLKELLYAADFAIVPIISGSGMRVKLSDYIISALPFITTKKGIEGITLLKNDIDCLIYESVNGEFLEGIKLLHKDKQLLKSFHKNLLKKSEMLTQEYNNQIFNFYSKLAIRKRIKEN